MKVFKGTDKDMKCRGLQYKLGEPVVEDVADMCNRGLHACESPLDVLGYYPPGEGSRYFTAEAEDVSDERSSGDSKIVCKKLTLAAEIGLPGLARAHVEYVKEHLNKEEPAATNTGYQSAATNTGDQSAATNTGDQSAATNTGDQSAATNTGDQSAATNTGRWSAATNTGRWSAATNTGYQSAATNTGYRSAATNTGDQSAATNTGYQSAATNTGDQSAATNTGRWSAATNTGYRSAATVADGGSVAIVTGCKSKAKAGLGSAICICERGEWNGEAYPLLAIKAAMIDGEILKPDTWYRLENGEFVEVQGDE